MFHSKRKLAVSILALTTILASTQSAYAALTIGATSIATDGAYTLDGVAGSVYAIGASTTTGTITIGGTAQTGAITLGSSTGVGQTVNIGSGATTGSDIVNIGTGAATTLKTVNVGTVGAVVSASTVNISNTSDATGTQTVSIGSAAKGANVLTLEGGTAAAALQIGNGATAHGIQIGSNATAANAVKLGGAHASSVTTIEGGTAAGAILIGNGATAHGIQIGNGAAVNTVILGSTNTTSTLALNAGVDDTTAGITVTGAINGASPLSFEGSTANAFETTLAVTDPTADRTVTVPNRSGRFQMASTCSALTPGVAVTLTVDLSNCYTDTITTDNQDQTITFSAGGTAGDMITIVFQTDGAGVGDEVITFESTLTNSVGTLTLANLAAGRYAVTFMSDGTVWNEVARTAALS